MAPEDPLRSTTLNQRVVLLALATLSVGDRFEAPYDATDVRSVCHERFTGPDGPVVGRVPEADVMSALNELGSSDLVEEADRPDTSPVGKGRPSYRLAIDPPTVFDTCEDDDRLADVVAAVRSE